MRASDLHAARLLRRRLRPPDLHRTVHGGEPHAHRVVADAVGPRAAPGLPARSPGAGPWRPARTRHLDAALHVVRNAQLERAVLRAGFEPLPGPLLRIDVHADGSVLRGQIDVTRVTRELDGAVLGPGVHHPADVHHLDGAVLRAQRETP